MKAGIGIGRMRPAIRVDAAQPIAVALAQYRDAAGREQNFEGVVGNEHPARHAGRETMIDDGEGTSSVLFRVHVVDLLRSLRFPGRPIALLLRDLIADHRRPNAAPIRELGECLPILHGRRSVDGILVGGDGRHYREPATDREGHNQCSASDANPHMPGRIPQAYVRLPII